MKRILNRAVVPLGLVVALWLGHGQAAVVSISKPSNSDDADCLPLRDGVYQVAVPPYPLDVGLGIGNIVNPVYPETYGDFVIHDHQYVAPHIPDPARSVVTYRFQSPTVVGGLEFAQHMNGITAVEGFVGDDSGTLVSMGTVFGPRGDVTGSSVFAEFERNVFTFTNTSPGLFFRFVIRKTSLADGLALYRAFPLDPGGLHIPAAPAEIIVTTEPALLTENSGVANIRVQRLIAVGQAATIRYGVTGGTATPGMDFVLTNGVLEFAAGVTNLTIPLMIIDDALREGPETILLGLTNSASGFSAQVQLSIQDSDSATLHVWLGSPNPTPPYLTWATAATNIQDAVDAALPGETVLVTNGVYTMGGRDGNRVTIANAIRLESVNGPLVTTIDGGSGPFGGRCVYLGSSAVLSGLTLTHGVALQGGGVFAEPSGIVTNCVIIGNLAGYYMMSGSGGGAYGGTLYNCTVANNTARSGIATFYPEGGGGASGSTLYNCTVTGNSAYDGGGTYGSILYNCTLAGNSGGYGYGGGAMSSTLYNCTLTGNSASDGGGAMSSTLYSCTVTENASGGASGSTFYNCTVTGNEGGGVGNDYRTGAGSTLYNSIVYYNFGGNYAEGTTLNYCCTTPLPAGPGNIEADPQLVSVSHLSLASPCVGAGNATYASGLDIDGEIWANPPCMGADQLTIGSVTGALTMQVEILYTNCAAGYAIPFVAQNTGRILASVWDFGDGTLVTNRAFVSHAWTAPGVYTVRLTGYNDSFPAGVASTVQVEVADGVHYVNVANLNPVFPYASWATAATNIQDAVTASTVPGRLVLVTNGVYRTGSVEANGPNRVALTNTLVLRSVNGPEVTTIEGASGDQPVRCAYVGNRAVLSGFTLTRGKADAGGGACSEASGVVTNCALTGNSAGGGGGASGGTLYNCTLTGNSAIGDYGYGGGVSGSMLYHCTLKDNSAYGGGGASGGELYDCVLSGNRSPYGGGAYLAALYNCELTFNQSGGAAGCTLYNCTVTRNSGGGVVSSWFASTVYNSIVYHNLGGNYAEGTTLNYCCTTPLPAGPGNIAADPRFMNAAAGDFRLRPDSPCIDAGTNLAGLLVTDIAGLPRLLDGNGDGVARVDMGAYEFSPYRFEPTLQMTANGLVFTVRGEPGKSVRIERSRDLLDWEWAATVPIPANGQTLIDPAATTEPRLFYRAIRVP